MTRRKDWCIDAARRIVDLTQGLSRDVQVNYIASELKMAHSRGGIEATKANGAAKAKEKDLL